MESVFETFSQTAELCAYNNLMRRLQSDFNYLYEWSFVSTDESFKERVHYIQVS